MISAYKKGYENFHQAMRKITDDRATRKNSMFSWINNLKKALNKKKMRLYTPGVNNRKK